VSSVYNYNYRLRKRQASVHASGLGGLYYKKIFNIDGAVYGGEEAEVLLGVAGFEEVDDGEDEEGDGAS
jgi:hypothetical protein